VTVENEYMKLV